MTVADSDVLIDYLRGRGDAAARIARELESRSLATTSITAFELRSGVRSPRQAKAVDALLDAMTILPFGPDEARFAAELRRQIEGKGQPIGMADYMIAGTCVATDGVLLTRNRKHFARVPGLRLGDPFDSDQ
jgi:tRNA(fMet)-specific endonuclease VapC